MQTKRNSKKKLPSSRPIIFFRFRSIIRYPSNRIQHECNTTIDIERNRDELFRLTTALTTRQFTYVGYKKLLKTFTAAHANDYSFECYDHNLIRSNQDQFLDDDKFANPQITENFLN